MLDLLTLSVESDVSAEICRQDLEFVIGLQLDQTQARVNVSHSPASSVARCITIIIIIIIIVVV